MKKNAVLLLGLAGLGFGVYWFATRRPAEEKTGAVKTTGTSFGVPDTSFASLLGLVGLNNRSRGNDTRIIPAGAGGGGGGVDINGAIKAAKSLWDFAASKLFGAGQPARQEGTAPGKSEGYGTNPDQGYLDSIETYDGFKGPSWDPPERVVYGLEDTSGRYPSHTPESFDAYERWDNNPSGGEFEQSIDNLGTDVDYA